MKTLVARVFELEKKVKGNKSHIIRFPFGEPPPENTDYDCPVMFVPYFDCQDDWDKTAAELQDRLIASSYTSY